MMASDESAFPLRTAQRLQGIGVSEIMKVTMLADQLKAQGRDIKRLTFGEPDFDTPERIKAAAIRAMKDGETKYTAVSGTQLVKQAVRDKFRRENGVEYTLEEILVSSGAKQTVFNAMMATIDAGDEVIIPAPFWLSYGDIAA